MTSLGFEFPTEFDLDELMGEISSHHLVIADRDKSKQISYFDTFDWRLFNRDMVLCKSGNNIILKQLKNGLEKHRIPSDIQPVFAWELPDSQLRQEIAPLIGLRALIKLADFKFKWKNYRILNEDQKTIAQISIEEISSPQAENSPVLSQLLLLPVRGYPRYYRELTNLFTRIGFVSSSYKEVYIQRLKFIGKNAGDYSSKLDFQLDPVMKAELATKIILRFLLEVIRKNEEGIKKDIDTEFLHDFRVATRRTRSVLGQVKGVFPADITERFKQDFAVLGNLTNPLRDLDVYLLNETTYKSMLPEFLQEEIEPLFKHLRKKRSSALQTVVEGLESEEYSKIMDDWKTFLNQPPMETPSAPNANRSIINLASARIYNRFRKVVKDGIRALSSQDEGLLHLLRIDCKKLRYLLEFFFSLYPQEQTSLLINQLKTLQDNLGEFHDLCFQQEYLLQIPEELAANGTNIQGTLVSIGSLVGTLENEKARVKGEFAKIFNQFKSQQNRTLFKELFKKEENS